MLNIKEKDTSRLQSPADLLINGIQIFDIVERQIRHYAVIFLLRILILFQSTDPVGDPLISIDLPSTGDHLLTQVNTQD